MLKKTLIGLALAGAVVGYIGQAYGAGTQAATNGFTPKQKKEIGEITKQYLLDNPNVLIEVSQKLQKQQIEVAQKAAIKAIGENVKDLVSTNSPILGNPEGSIVLVQFIDYQCGHCKKMHPIIAKLTAENKQLKVVSKNLGILGENSVVAAKASLAANMQGKFEIFHDALEKTTEPLTHEKIIELAKLAGLDVAKLEQDMKSETVSKEMANTIQLAQKIGLGGTPAFIVLSDIKNSNIKVFFAAGAVSQETLQEYINQAKS